MNSKIFYSTTTESFGNRIERSRAMLVRLVQLDQSLAYKEYSLSACLSVCFATAAAGRLPQWLYWL